MTPDLTGLIKDLGFPIALSVALAWFLASQVWPFIVAQVQSAQQQRSAERGEFLAALQARDEQLDRLVEAINALTNRLEIAGILKKGR